MTKKIIIDTSALIATLLDEPEKKKLIKLTNNSTLLAPHSLNFEIGNAFSAMFKKNRILLEEAQKAIEIYKSIPIQFVNVDISKALKISHKSNIYAYDAYMIVAALLHNAPLLTLDELLKKIAIKNKVNILEVC